MGGIKHSCVCVCEREREREREKSIYMDMYIAALLTLRMFIYDFV